MKSITGHISYLLLTCRKVYVEGLGTFEAFYQKASFDMADGTFYPSRIRIRFVDNEKNMDNTTLVDSLIRQNNVEPTEARRFIEEFVAKTTHQLNKRKYCRLEGIGYLMINNNKISLIDSFWKRHHRAALNSILVS